jgi:hypothetical protein
MLRFAFCDLGHPLYMGELISVILETDISLGFGLCVYIGEAQRAGRKGEHHFASNTPDYPMSRCFLMVIKLQETSACTAMRYRADI